MSKGNAGMKKKKERHRCKSNKTGKPSTSFPCVLSSHNIAFIKL